MVSPFVALTIGVDLDTDEHDNYIALGRQIKKARERLVNDHGFPRGKNFFSQMKKKSVTRAAGIEIGKYNSALVKRKALLSSAEEKRALVDNLAPIISYSRGAIVYCGDIKSAGEINEAICSESDITSSAYHSQIPADDQRHIMEGFRKQDIKCLVAVDMLDEGVDIPHADLAIILSSTQQKRQLIQRLGRILRKKDGQRGSVLTLCYANGTSEDPYHPSNDSGMVKISQLELAREVIRLTPNKIQPRRIVKQIQQQICWG
ncbi:MAG: hypothetical protein CMJ30_02455 [Phycisphaerae bacterium]|nr:hypothetical protein [Phycisphaerae bacterium]